MPQVAKCPNKPCKFYGPINDGVMPTRCPLCNDMIDPSKDVIREVLR